MNEFNPKAGSVISGEQAKKMIADFKTSHPHMMEAYYFGAENFLALLAIPGCVGIRTYHGVNEIGNMVHVMVPTDEKGRDILVAPDGTSSTRNGGQACPPFCNI